MDITYTLINIDSYSKDGSIDVYVLAKYKEIHTKVFRGSVTKAYTDDISITQDAWPIIQPKIQQWVDNIDRGTFLIGKTFVPDDSGSLTFE